jgi:ABC-2 type transport system permease protein
MTTLRIIKYALLSGAKDYGAIYTWKTWLSAWFVRVLFQVAFFALVGRLLGDETHTWFLLIGNATMLAAMEGMFALNMVAWERNVGSLPLIAASPTNPVVILASRGGYLVADGAVSALGALVVLGPVFGLALPMPRVLLVIPLTILVGVSAYCLGTFLGGITIGYRRSSNIIVNVGLVTVMALCAVNVPLATYPRPIAWISKCLPVTHGLIAIRDVFAGDLAAAGQQALIEFGIAALWLVICVLTFQLFVRRGRRDGTLDFAV